jgi:hypothetical protein
MLEPHAPGWTTLLEKKRLTSDDQQVDRLAQETA